MKQPGTELVLGTALWGWVVDQAAAHGLMDAFYAHGHRHVDTATNYPIDKNPRHLGLSQEILADWLSSHGVSDLAIVAKIGSVANDGSPIHRLDRNYLLKEVDRAKRLFGANLARLSVHWDNRDDAAAIDETLQVFREVRDAGIGIGLSGIRVPDMYAARAPELARDWVIQVKHNLLSTRAYHHYGAFHDHASFWAYGLNAGGLGFGKRYHDGSSATVRRVEKGIDLSRFERFVRDLPADLDVCPTTFNELAMLFVQGHPDFTGLMIGPSSQDQLRETMVYHDRLSATDTREIYARLCRCCLDTTQEAANSTETPRPCVRPLL